MSQYTDARKSVDITLDGHDPAADIRSEFTYPMPGEPAPISSEPSRVMRPPARRRRRGSGSARPDSASPGSAGTPAT